MKTRIALLSLLTGCCLMLAVTPARAGYSNGPYNGTTDAWTINFGFSVSDSFVLGGDLVNGLHLVYWDASASDILTTVDAQFGSTSFGGSTHTLSGVTNTFLGTNQYGYELFQADYTFNPIQWSGGGAGYVTLSNACSTSGCSSNPIYWDENSGPSTAYENTLGSIPSETFTINGCSGCVCDAAGPDCGQTPEPGTITLLFGSGIVGLAGALRRWLIR